MATYDEAERKEYATVGKDSYPIGDRAHARAALSRINQGGLSSSQKDKVRAKADRMLGKSRKGGSR
jgi:hypothetical protein